eukprot:15391205-Heterocapsa_arctica.AAC.1
MVHDLVSLATRVVRFGLGFGQGVFGAPFLWRGRFLPSLASTGPRQPPPQSAQQGPDAPDYSVGNDP